MTVHLKKVAGGYELFIPDELAARTGLREGVAIEADEMADMLIVKQPEFVAAAREALYAGLTPDTFHDPREPYPPPPSFESPPAPTDAASPPPARAG